MEKNEILKIENLMNNINKIDVNALSSISNKIYLSLYDIMGDYL